MEVILFFAGVAIMNDFHCFSLSILNFLWIGILVHFACRYVLATFFALNLINTLFATLFLVYEYIGSDGGYGYGGGGVSAGGYGGGGGSNYGSGGDSGGFGGGKLYSCEIGCGAPLFNSWIIFDSLFFMTFFYLSQCEIFRCLWRRLWC